MLKFIINILTLLSGTTLLFAQADSIVSNEKKASLGLRPAYDIGKKIWSRYRGGNIDQIALHLNYNNHIAGIVWGKEQMPFTTDRYDFFTSGSYFKLEYAYNFYENWPGTSNEITLGIRYAHATFDYTLYRFQRIPSVPVFMPADETFSREFKRLDAHWLEITSAVRAEIFRGLYLELHISGKYYLNGKRPQNFGLIYIPGFHTTNVSKFGFGLGYGISYYLRL